MASAVSSRTLPPASMMSSSARWWCTTVSTDQSRDMLALRQCLGCHVLNRSQVSAVIDLVGDRAELTNCPMSRPVPAFPAPPRTHCPSGESSLRVEGIFFQKLFISSRDYGCVHRTPGACRAVAFAMRELVTGPRGNIIRSTSLNAGREQMLVRDVARGAAASTAA